MALQYWASAKLCGVEQRVPPIFGRAAITLGIGPHSSFKIVSQKLKCLDLTVLCCVVFVICAESYTHISAVLKDECWL